MEVTEQERLRLQIETYIPGEPDPDLEPMEYYMQDSAGRVIRVFANSIGWDDEGEIRRGARISNGNGVYNAPGCITQLPSWYYVWALYDNEEDCRHQTHQLVNRWEWLRKIQQEARAEA